MPRWILAADGSGVDMDHIGLVTITSQHQPSQVLARDPDCVKPAILLFEGTADEAREYTAKLIQELNGMTQKVKAGSINKSDLTRKLLKVIKENLKIYNQTTNWDEPIDGCASAMYQVLQEELP